MSIRKGMFEIAGFMAGLALLLVAASAGAEDKLLHGTPVRDTSRQGGNPVWRHCLTPQGNDQKLGGLSREHPWSLPAGRLADDFDTTIHCLVLRYNFLYEATDDPNTTGRGQMDLSRPLDTLTDSAYIARVGYLIDPPSHDSAYFDAHLRALNRYWEQVSEGRVHLIWDIYPPYCDSVYELPYTMNQYGRCSTDSIIYGLERYFIDCLQLADTAHLQRPGDSARWNIDFSKYQAFFLFHAGSDRQNDIGFPTTCCDMYTGFIRFGGTVEVDDGSVSVRTALMMPETVVQDGRVTALNTVLAHEFGHQLGLVDIYDTRTFMSQIGDFGLMDNAGFGSSLDFGFPAGNVFGAIPVYPCAWSRAYLGFVDVPDIRRDTSAVRIAAASLPPDTSTKVVRIPISETEYYLLENRWIDTLTALLADSATSVILGPVDSNRAPTGQYDYLLPGSGMLIYLIDEAVAALDYDGDGLNNFDDNHVQWWLDDQERKLLTLMEADGLVGFGGYYRSGYGRAEDMFRDDRNHSFTPNTNPAAIDNTGNNTHVYVTNIRRQDTVIGNTLVYDDRVMFVDVEFDRKADGFPVRMGIPVLPLAPIADDLDDDGAPEIVVASGKLLSVVRSDGQDFIRSRGDYDTITCPWYYDSAITYVNTGAGYNPAAPYRVAVFAETPNVITTCPVTGQFPGWDKMVAVGYPADSSHGLVTTYTVRDNNGDARADSGGASILTNGWPLALSFGDRLDILTSTGYIYRYDSLGVAPDVYIDTTDDRFYGICRLGNRLVIVGGDSAGTVTRFTVIPESLAAPSRFVCDGVYTFGPVVADLNRDDTPEIIAFTADGHGLYLSVDTTTQVPTFDVLCERATGCAVTVNPIVGDVDGDGYADVIVGGIGAIRAYDAGMIDKTDFPIEIDDRFPDSTVIAPPVMADIERGGRNEIVFPTSAGNMCAFGDRLATGFPLSSGRQAAGVSGSSAVVFGDESGGKLGYLGGDGWLYAWEVDADTTTAYWPMIGGGPSGHFVLATEALGDPKPLASRFDEHRYYNYPNPVSGDATTLRYYLGEDARSVNFDIYDLSGVRIAELAGTTTGLADNEVVWSCSGVAPGVYRCMIEVEFAGATERAFTDIAIVR